jgi:hypothetical protein
LTRGGAAVYHARLRGPHRTEGASAHGKEATRQSQGRPAAAPLLAEVENPRRRVLILPRYLEKAAEDKRLLGQRFENAHKVLIRWADLEKDGHLEKKETTLDADFIREVFGEALGYQPSTLSPERYQQQRNFTVSGVGTADGALGDFSRSASSPVAVTELKGAAIDLDRDRSNGRTAVQQCWDYLNALSDCPWGIVSNYSRIRLYHRDKTPLAYEEFRLQGLRNAEAFRRYYCLFEVGGLLRSALSPAPRALRLLDESEGRRREVGDQLYQAYSENRFRLIDHLVHACGKPRDVAIHIAQKLLDRIIFVAFCEQRGLLPEKCLDAAYRTVPPFSRVTNPRWQNFLSLFRSIDKGHKDLNLDVGYDGGLFRHDPAVDDLQLGDEWTEFFKNVGEYDFRDEVNVDVLGHIFEKSVGELERLRHAGFFDAGGNGGGGVADHRGPGGGERPGAGAGRVGPGAGAGRGPGVGRGGGPGGLPGAARRRRVAARLPAVRRAAADAADGVRAGVPGGAPHRGVPAAGPGGGRPGGLRGPHLAGPASPPGPGAGGGVAADDGSASRERTGRRR